MNEELKSQIECVISDLSVMSMEPGDTASDAITIIRKLQALLDQPEGEDIMHRLYQRLAPLAFMPAEVSQEEAKRLGYPHIRLNDVETAIRAELCK